MNNKNLYLITLMFLGFMLYTQWYKDFAPTPLPVNETTLTNTNSGSNNVASIIDDEIPESQPFVNDDIPEPLNNNNSNDDVPAAINKDSTTQIITYVETPLLKLEFSAEGAALVYAELKAYPLEKKNAAKHVVLMDYRDNQFKINS